MPPQLRAKITDASDLLRLLLHHATGASSLETTPARAGATGLPSISAVSLHKWERKAAPWLALLVAKMLRADGACADFEGDTIGATGSSSPTVHRFRDPALTGTRQGFTTRCTFRAWSWCAVRSPTWAAALRRFDVQAGELWIGDRAYGTPPGVTSVWAQDGAVLVRINRTHMPLFSTTGARIDLDAELAQVPNRDAPVERPAFVHGPQGD